MLINFFLLFFSDDLYGGSENPMLLISKYSIVFTCRFHLKYYPFDAQHCKYMVSLRDMADVINLIIVR